MQAGFVHGFQQKNCVLIAMATRGAKEATATASANGRLVASWQRVAYQTSCFNYNCQTKAERPQNQTQTDKQPVAVAAVAIPNPIPIFQCQCQCQ